MTDGQVKRKMERIARTRLLAYQLLVRFLCPEAWQEEHARQTQRLSD